MKLYKKSERTTKTATMRKALRECGFTVKELGTWCKWKDMMDGGRLQVKITIYEIEHAECKQGYLISDTLDRVAAPIIVDKQEVMGWLKEHGYKTEKRWYMEDCGMDESTWNYWNGLEER